ncbi:response regulator transcription factor [Vagococcus fessus]|uniref:DNA-binding response regulator n=1 Tax=Vagococcus fessus TaxID=120370 RepID=A0A430A8W1_9ENTE|nr:response regulator transcription factor [Vagococcus fessus]RSU03538.1 hypothetical protein CBF31_07450 [Vagococcus fessus]
MKIILLDNDSNDSKKLKSFLESQNYTVFQAESKSQLTELISTNQIDFLLIDPLSSEGNDYYYIEELKTTYQIPLIIISAFNDETNVVAGLSAGADDYLSKPIRYQELVARLNKIIKHQSNNSHSDIMLFDEGTLCITPSSRQVFIQGQEVKLTHSEYLLLLTLAGNPTKYFSRSELLDQVKGIDFDGHDRIIDSHIKDLRKKIEPDPKEPRYIITVHGSGYRFGPLDTFFN